MSDCIYFRKPCYCVMTEKSKCGNQKDDYTCATYGDPKGRNKVNDRFKDGESPDYKNLVDRISFIGS